MNEAQNLQNLFDAQPKTMLISYEKTNPYIEGLLTPFGKDSQLDFPKQGLTFLLGKNGSGKTKLLKGISSLDGDSKNEFPNVTLVFDWPSRELLFQWSKLASESFIPPLPLNVVQSGSRVEKTEQLIRINSEPFTSDLPLLSAILSSITTALNPEFPSPFEDLTCEEVLQYFNFSQQDISDWKIVQKNKKDQLTDPSLRDHIPEFEPDYLTKYSIANYCVESFLSGITKSRLISNRSAPVPQFFADLWIQDELNRERFKNTYQEFFKLISKFSLERIYKEQSFHSKSTSKWSIRFLAPIGISQQLVGFYSEYLEIQKQSRAEFAEYEQENEEDIRLDSVEMGFPFSLLSPITIDGETYLQSHAFNLPDIGSGGSLNWPMNLLEVTEFDPSDSQKTSRDLLEELSKRLLSVNTSESTVDSFSFDLIGLSDLADLIDQVSLHVNKIDSGISAIRSSVPIIDINSENSNFMNSRIQRSKTFNATINPLLITLEWQDKNSGDWLELSRLSLGQRDILMVFLKLLSMQYSQAPKKYKLLLIDEFDKHLHPSATEKVLTGIHDFALANQLSVIVSTHSIPLLKSNELRNRPRIFATRDAIHGGFEYTDGGYTDPLTVAEVLGTSEVDALRLKDLIVVLEGDMDQLIIEKYINQADDNIFERIHITHATGLDGFQGLWGNLLRLVDNKVLFIYDKRDEEIERGWVRIKENDAASKHGAKAFDPLYRLFLDTKTSSKHSRGHHEKLKMLYLLKNVCESPLDINRVDIHGVEYDDIVDALPFNNFKNSKTPEISSWEVAHLKFTNGSSLKDHFGINLGKIKNVLSKVKLQDPELEKILFKLKKSLSN
jgi:energy-coupling factor transporter ATP-binding protein EcfA2